MDALGEMESRFPVTQWSVASVAVWPLIRVRWFLTEWAAHFTAGGSTGAARAAGLARRLVAGPLQTALAHRRNGARRGPRPCDLLFLSDGVSYGKVGGQWLERFCDPVMRAAATRGLTSRLLCPTYLFRAPAATPALYIQPSLDRANVVGALRARALHADAVLPDIEKVSAWAAARGFGTASLQRAKVVSDGCRLTSLARAYARYLAEARPRLAFLVSYYGVEGMAFVLACHRAGVKVVDLQHGAPGELHPAYARLPKPRARVHDLVPDRFWVWSDWERGLILQWAAGTGHGAIVGGDVWMSVWQSERGWPGVADEGARADRLASRAAGRPIVLVSLQWGLRASEQLEPMQQLVAAGRGRFEFWVRLHPSMLGQREEVRRVLGSDGYELDEPTDLPLPVLLARCGVHITHCSSVAVEAAELGVHTVVTSELGEELYGRLVAAGWVVKETGDPVRVLALLDRLARERRVAKPAQVRLDEALDELLAQS